MGRGRVEDREPAAVVRNGKLARHAVRDTGDSDRLVVLRAAGVETGVSILVDGPGEDVAVPGEGDVFDVPVRRLEPRRFTGVEVIERETGEFTVLVGDEIETGPVRRPRSGHLP